jgi:hypothetical protein
VIGSYFAAEYVRIKRPRRRALANQQVQRDEAPVAPGPALEDDQPVATVPSNETSSESRTLSAPISPR